MSYRPALLLALLPLLPAFAQDLPTAVAERVELPAEQVFTGVVEPVDRSTVSAQTSGRVEAILVDVDDTVEQGAVILRLRDREQQAALRRAEADLAEARARLQETEAEYQRRRDLRQRNLVPAAELEAALAARDAARARVEAAEAGVALAREALERTVITAPYSGVVQARHVALGEAVQPGQPLLSGFSLERLRVLTEVPQRLLEPIRREASAKVRTPAGDSIAAADLTFFPYADPQSSAFRVRVGLPENASGLLPGMVVAVAFRSGARSTLLVPEAALVRRGELSAVYVLTDAGPRLRQVLPGATTADGHIEILAGLEAGERVALDPLAATRAAAGAP